MLSGQVIRRVGKVKYSVDVGGRRKCKKLYHVNMLKKWQVQESTGYLMKSVDEEVESEDEIVTWDDGEDGEPKIGEKLSEIQRKELSELLKQY